MPGQQPIRTGDDDRVIPFRPRPTGEAPQDGAHPVAVTRDPDAPAQGLTLLKFTPRPRPAPARAGATLTAADPMGPEELAAADERRRTLANVSALIFTLALTALSVWLATTLTEMRRTQDCVLVGRRDCTRIPLPSLSTMRPDRP